MYHIGPEDAGRGTSMPFDTEPSPKTLCIPTSRPVRVSGLLPLLEHPHFQKLKFRQQLGVNHLVFPGAVHTRFEHSIGVLDLAGRIGEAVGLAPADARHLQAFALLHDLGHGPYSHQIEPVIAGGDHHANGLRLLDDLKDACGACGLDHDRLRTLFAGDDPLHLLVSDRNLGADKLDYLRRDALHIGFSGMPDVEPIIQNLFFRKGRLGIEEKAIEEVKRIQKFYGYLHQHGYLNKTALTLQRIFQRAVQEELASSKATGEELWRMTDRECWAFLAAAQSPLSRRLATLLDGREFHRTAVAFKPRNYGFVERVAGKPLAVVERSQAFLQKFSDACHDYRQLCQLEDQLAAILGLQPGDVLFAAMPYFKKLLPRDVRILASGETYGLFEKDDDHYRSIHGDYLRTFAVRVVAPPALRQQVFQQADRVAEFIAAQVQPDPA